MGGPDAFVTVSATRTVMHSSAAATTYDVPVSPAMSAQFAPPASQRCHW